MHNPYYDVYTGHKVRIDWSGVQSHYFSVMNGVKQGGVLSPVLYTLYTDRLLMSLSRSSLGCYYDSFFVWALAKARSTS